MTYTTFARVYDEIMDADLYDKWLDFTKRHTAPAKTLELASGSGKLAIKLAKEGYDVSALDLSNEMLVVASGSADEAGVEIKFIEGDMLDLSEIETYDVVTCYSDSICYLSNFAETQLMLDEVYNVLNEGGVFLFDVHSTYQINEGFKDYSFHVQDEDYAFLWDSYPGDAPNSVEHELTFFIKEEDEKFARYDELHEERTYSIDEYLMGLETAGFHSVEVFADFTDENPTETSKRWFFKAIK
ncbi:MAG: class I SAM-dependent methyltransferase [Lactobacillales bacterium]|jgi:ubiquinone/menaquinone biosynthesis C-methylase UbiE|nr:class I SAM-dependent methyltransferase [Lactobacillales bacterium]